MARNSISRFSVVACFIACVNYIQYLWFFDRTDTFAYLLYIAVDPEIDLTDSDQTEKVNGLADYKGSHAFNVTFD